jgi:death-associated protein 6
MKILIKVCRRAEPSDDMKAVIKKKLLKYYHSVHPTYITSKNFLKTLKTITDEIIKDPHMVYSKLKTVVEELDARRKIVIQLQPPPVEPVPSTSEATPGTSETVTEPATDSLPVQSTGDDKRDKHLKKLHKALVNLKREILDLEEQEVDWEDDDNSAYVKKVRFEKRACEIYKKVRRI